MFLYPCCLKYSAWIHCPACLQIWNIEQEKDREKEKVRLQASEGQREKGRERSRAREKKRKTFFFVGRTTSKFCSGGDKIRKASGHQCKMKMRGNKLKKVNENMYDISSIKRATIKEVSGSFTLSRAKKRQRNLQNK